MPCPACGFHQHEVCMVLGHTYPLRPDIIRHMKKSRRRQQNQAADGGTKKKKHHKTVLEVDVVTRHVSPPAQGVLELMNTGGLRLRVAHGNGDASVVDAFPNIPTGEHPTPRPITADIASELIASGLLHKMAKDRVQDRTGWAEAGLDGNAADFYSLLV